jgi:hypothetical protein
LSGTVNGRALNGGGASKRGEPIATGDMAALTLVEDVSIDGYQCHSRKIKTSGKILQEKKATRCRKALFMNGNFELLNVKSQKSDSTSIPSSI